MGVCCQSECCEKCVERLEAVVDRLCQEAKSQSATEGTSLIQLLKSLLSNLIQFFSSDSSESYSSDHSSSIIGQRVAGIFQSHFGEALDECASEHTDVGVEPASEVFSSSHDSDSIGGINILEPQNWDVEYDFSGLDPDNSDSSFTSDYDFGGDLGSGWDSDGYSFGGSTDGSGSNGGSDQGGGER